MFDLDTIWLKINYFFLSHKADLKKWWVILLIATDAFIVVFIMTNLALYFIGVPRQNKIMTAMASNVIDYQQISNDNQPIELSVLSTTAYVSGLSKFDLIAVVNNSNHNWAAESITYKFNFQGEDTEVFTDNIMPNTQKYLAVQGIEWQLGSRLDPLADYTVSFEVVDIKWIRVVNFDELDLISFAVDNIDYSQTSSSGLTIHSVKTEVTNNYYRGFWDSRFIIVLFSGDTIVGVDHVHFDEFNAGATISIYSQFDYIPFQVSNILVEPDFNYINLDNIIS